MRNALTFLTGGSVATPPEVLEFQIRGTRIGTQLSVIMISLLWCVQVLTGAEDSLRASLYCGIQISVYVGVWVRLLRATSEQQSEFLAYVTATTLSLAASFAAWPSKTGTNPYRLLAFVIPLVGPALSAIRPQTAFVLGIQLALVHPFVALFAPFDNMMSIPQAAVVALFTGIAGAVAAHAQRRLQEELSCARDDALQAARLKSEFLANLSHEVRTPMTAILGYTEAIREELDPTPNPTVHESIAAVHRHGRALLRHIDRVIDFSLLEADRLPISKRACKLADLVRATASAFAREAEAKGLRFTTNLEPGGEATVPAARLLPASVYTDPDRVHQILEVLLENAVKFTASGGVELEVRRDDASSQLLFLVRDSGEGVPEERLESIFRPFEQVDGSHRRRAGGVGMGLAIAHPLALRLGGDLRACRREPSGMEFELRLPCEEVAPVVTDEAGGRWLRSPHAEALSTQGRSLAGCRILLAEDGPDNQRLMIRILERAGATVDLAENGQIAADSMLRSLRDGSAYDVVLMDIQMPVMDGYQATRQIREAGYEGPIAAVTAHVLEADRERCLAAGCDDYLPKPITARDLVNLVAGLLAKFQPRAERV